MRQEQPTEESFLKDVAKHEMKVLHDDGVYRHLRFSSGSFNQQFDIVTYPWHLVFSGDMGCYVFNRLEDMFQFFRGRPSDKKGLYINTGYWGEKLEAVARHNGYHKYNADFVREQVKEHADEWIEENNLSKEDAEALREDLEEEINYDDGMHEAYRTISGFSHKVGEDAYWRQDTRSLVAAKTPKFDTFEFQDIFEWRWEDYTYHYVWCCLAIAWAIQQYDKPKLQFEVTETKIEAA
jgi:hypothetical protein